MHMSLGGVLSAECTRNYTYVPPVMTVCVMGDINIGAVISQALKLATTRSRMLFLPKQSEEKDICLHSLVTPSQCQKFPHCLTQLSAATESDVCVCVFVCW